MIGGWIKWPDRGNNLPPDRTLKNVKFSNTFLYRTRGQSASKNFM